MQKKMSIYHAPPVRRCWENCSQKTVAMYHDIQGWNQTGFTVSGTCRGQSALFAQESNMANIFVPEKIIFTSLLKWKTKTTLSSFAHERLISAHSRIRKWITQSCAHLDKSSCESQSWHINQIYMPVPANSFPANRASSKATRILLME